MQAYLGDEHATFTEVFKSLRLVHEIVYTKPLHHIVTMVHDGFGGPGFGIGRLEGLLDEDGRRVRLLDCDGERRGGSQRGKQYVWVHGAELLALGNVLGVAARRKEANLAVPKHNKHGDSGWSESSNLPESAMELCSAALLVQRASQSRADSAIRQFVRDLVLLVELVNLIQALRQPVARDAIPVRGVMYALKITC